MGNGLTGVRGLTAVLHVVLARKRGSENVTTHQQLLTGNSVLDKLKKHSNVKRWIVQVSCNL